MQIVNKLSINAQRRPTLDIPCIIKPGILFFYALKTIFGHINKLFGFYIWLYIFLAALNYNLNILFVNILFFIDNNYIFDAEK